ISKEVQELLADESSMNIMYPDTYSWETALALMNQMMLKPAFWYLINLYSTDKEKVMKVVLQYDSIIEMDKALISAMYTYGMIDPSVATIQNNKPEITRPDIAESKLAIVKEMVKYIVYYRNQKG
ncbi:MAG: hypothetical protein AAGK97_07530, partial [Bacteroidota bacterium]